MGFRRLVWNLFRHAGYDISYRRKDARGQDPFRDMQFYLGAESRPVIFDVGANVGQTVDSIQATFPKAIVHAFEPSPSTYASLAAYCNGRAGVHTWNYGIGSKVGELPLLENSESEMTSFLAPGERCWGTVQKSTTVPVITLDSFAAENRIDFVHVLKSDTQGYDLEVFRGAEGLMRDGKIALVYFEINFAKMYQGMPPFCEVLQFLIDSGFVLACIYECKYQRGIASWTDMLFVNEEFNRRRE